MNLRRGFSTLIFDREMLLKNKIRASLYKSSDAYRAFFDLPLLSITNKIAAVRRDLSSLAFVGPNPKFFLKNLDSLVLQNIKRLYVCDCTKESLDKSMEELKAFNNKEKIELIPKLIDDEKWTFKAKSLDGIVSNLQLHWANNLDHTLEKLYESLVKDGMLIFSMIGGDSLKELKLSFAMAEQEREGGLSPVVAPMINLQDLGDLLASSGYRINTTDKIRFAYEFASIFDLMKFLQLIGETNIGYERRRYKSKDTFIAAGAIYQTLFNKSIYNTMNTETDKIIPIDLFVETKDRPTNIIATFDVTYGIGWREPRKSAETRKISDGERFSMGKFVKELKKVGDVKYGTIEASGELVEL